LHHCVVNCTNLVFLAQKNRILQKQLAHSSHERSGGKWNLFLFHAGNVNQMASLVEHSVNPFGIKEILLFFFFFFFFKSKKTAKLDFCTLVDFMIRDESDMLDDD
jgi:hypothetical protein